MINGFEIVIDRERVVLEHVLLAEPSLPQAVKYINTCIPLAGIYEGQSVGACLMQQKDSVYDIVSLAVAPSYQGKGFSKEMLLYALDYARVQGGKYVEIGCGNSDVMLYSLFQKAGFRVVGVWPDHYSEDSKSMVVENGIIKRDMIRFRADLRDFDRLKITTLG